MVLSEIKVMSWNGKRTEYNIICFSNEMYSTFPVHQAAVRALGLRGHFDFLLLSDRNHS